jgi:Fe-S cluster assembly protein SufD
MTEMTTSSTATKAERGLIDAFARSAPALPGSGWVERVRRDAIGAFETGGLPTRRSESYRYTDLRERISEAYEPATGGAATSRTAAVSQQAIETALGPLAALEAARLVFVDGAYQADLSRTDAFGDAVEQMPLAPLLKKAPGWLEGKFADDRLGAADAVMNLNTAFMSDGLMIKIKPGKAAPLPVLVVSVRAASEPNLVTTRNIVAMEPGSSMTLIETEIVLPGAASVASSNALTDVTVADGASLTHVRCIEAGAKAQHLATWIVKVGADAAYRAFQLSSGTGLVRNGLSVSLDGTGSQLDVSGAYIAGGSGHIDTTLVVDHKVPGCRSRELFKGVLDGRARGVFQGKIIVRPGAVKTDGKQMARALMLSPDAEFDSKPELEIYADDVACGHGATAAEIDEDLLFYCTSRGIPAQQARRLLIEAFVAEAIEQIEDEAVREAIVDVARGWLQREIAG